MNYFRANLWMLTRCTCITGTLSLSNASMHYPSNADEQNELKRRLAYPIMSTGDFVNVIRNMPKHLAAVMYTVGG